MDITDCCLGLYFEFCKLYAFISISLSNCFKYLVENSEYVSYIERQRSICYHQIRENFTEHRVEPLIPWMGVFYNNNSNKYIENIISLDYNIDDNTIKNIKSEIPFTRFKPLFIIKLNKIYIYKLLRDNLTFNLDEETVQKYFLEIKYTHPSMDCEIDIIVNKNEYVNNNEILSFSYIEKYLNYQEEPFVFNDDYKLKIIDKDLESFELTSNEYITLYNKEYTVNEN